MVGLKKQDFWPKCTLKTITIPLYFEDTGSASSSIIGHDFRKYSGSKIEVGKKCYLQKWSTRLII